jgi:hypothetical protein
MLACALLACAIGYWAWNRSSRFQPPLYKTHLDRILASERLIAQGATTEEIRKLQLEVASRPDLKLVLPSQYLRFLKISNGFYYDNFGFESTKTFIECNEQWKSSGTPSHFVIFGGDETVLFVLDQISKQYHIMNWDDRRTRATFASFDEMVAEHLRSCRRP